MGDHAVVLRDLAGERETLGLLAIADNTTSSGPPPLLERRERAPWRETALELPADTVLRRTITLPEQVRGQVRKTVELELDRLTPFDRTEAYFDARVPDDSQVGTKIRVDLAVCRRDQALPWIEYLRHVAVPVDRLTWVGAWRNANLLPLAERPKRSSAGLLLHGLLGASILVLILALLITPLWQRQTVHRQLQVDLSDLRRKAADVNDLRAELEQAQRGSVAVIQRKLDAPRMTDLLRELTELLPDGTWVQTLNFRDGEVDIRGESTQATALIALLEKGPGISNVTFRSPVMQIASSGTERFHIAFDYRRPPT
jgi:general secretion pathway protein L